MSDVSASAGFTTDVVVIGGCGRVGLPLGIALAARGLQVTLYDINAAAVDVVNAGRLPFDEDGAAEPLATAVGRGAADGDDRPGAASRRPSTSS